MNIVAIVSARGGSKGIPRKNLRLLAGLPLVLHSIKNLSAVELIDKIVLSTEDDEISNVVKESNFSVDVMHRPKNLADDKTPLIKVTQHVAVELEKTGYRPDIVLQMAATCPFVKPETIKKCIIPLLENKTNCTTTLKRIEHEHPYRAKKLNPDGSFGPFIRDVDTESFLNRQQLPELYCTSGAIYARTFELLKKFSGKDFCLGPHPFGIIVNDIEAVNIDREIDFQFASFLMEKNFQIN